VINLSQDIQSLSSFKRNTNEMIQQMKMKGNPLVLTVNGRAEIVVQDAEAYQQILDKIAILEALVNQQQLTKNTSVSDLLDLYGAASDVEFAIDDRGISDEMDNELTGIFDE